MPTQADIDALFDDTTPPPATADDPAAAAGRAAIDGLFGDHPDAPVATAPRPAAAADGGAPTLPATPGPQDSDGIFTRPIAATGDFMARTWHSLKDAYTGVNKEDYPELTELPPDAPGRTVGGNLRLGLGYLTSSTPEQIIGIAKTALPGSTAGADKFGNPTITYDGQTYYVNKPGLSGADISQMAGQALPAALVATGIGAIPALAGRGLAAVLPRAIVQGAGQAELSIDRDLASAAVGSGQGVDPVRAGEAGIGGAIGEPLAAGAAAATRLLGSAAMGTWRALFGYGGKLLDDAGGAAASDPVTKSMLTRTGQMVFDKAGVDPASMTVGQVQGAEAALGRGGGKAIGEASDATAAQQAATRALQSGRYAIPMTTGQITGDPLQLALEDRLRQAASTAKPIMTAFGADQTAATERAAGGLVPGVQPGVAPPSEAELGQALIAQTQARAGALEQATSDAYTNLPFLTKVGMASQPGAPSATFSSGTSTELLNQMQDIAQRHAIYEGTPAARQAQTIISKLITVPSQDMAPGVEGVAAMNGVSPAPTQAMARPFNLGDLDTTLRQLNSLYDSAGNDADRAAVGAMRTAVHDRIDAAALNGAMSGDPAVMQNWQDARAASRTQHSFLQPDGQVVRQFMDGITSGKLTGQEVVNGLYGAGQLGAKGGAAQVLDHLQTQFQPGSPEWQTVQQAAVRRMLFGSTEKTAEMSPNNIANRITEATTGNGAEITQRLLDPDTIAGLTDFGDTMRTLQQSAKQNPSGTAYTAQNALKWLGTRIPMVGTTFRNEAVAVRQAQAAVGPGLPSRLTQRPTDLPLGAIRQTIAPAAGSVVMQDGGGPGHVPSAFVRYPYAAGANLGGLLSHMIP
jgi:hypothetical protein